MRRRGLDDRGRADGTAQKGSRDRLSDIHDALPMMTLVLGRLVQSTIVLQSFSNWLNYKILEIQEFRTQIIIYDSYKVSYREEKLILSLVRHEIFMAKL